MHARTHTMAEQHRLDHLNEAYYGPSIPPKEEPAAPAAAARRRIPLIVGDPYTLFCKAFRVLTLVLIAVGVVALVLWLVFQPAALKAYVDSAALTRFDLVGSNGTLNYDLTLAVTIRNPNRKQAVLYRRLEAVALYGGAQFGYAALPRMRQPRKSTKTIRPSFHGQSLLAGGAAAAFGREKVEGFFSVNVKLHTRVRLNLAVGNSVEYRPDVDCDIRVADPRNATAVAVGFTRTQCHVDDFS